MPRRLLTKGEKKRNRCFRLSDDEMKKLEVHARKTKTSQSRAIARWLATV